MDMFRPLTRYADFGGRARRREFWLYSLFLWAMLFLLMYADSALNLGGTAESYSEVGENGFSVGFNMTGGVLTAIFLFAMLIPSIAVSIRRLHDVGKSGWTFLFALVPLFGWAYLLFLYTQPGKPGPNRYGPDPKAGAAGVTI